MYMYDLYDSGLCVCMCLFQGMEFYSCVTLEGGITFQWCIYNRLYRLRNPCVYSSSGLHTIIMYYSHCNYCICVQLLNMYIVRV